MEKIPLKPTICIPTTQMSKEAMGNESAPELLFLTLLDITRKIQLRK